MFPTPKSCGVLLVHGDPVSSFLLMKHATRWDVPKGHIDPGETELECALREMEEETGISRSRVVINPDFRFTHQYEVDASRYGGAAGVRELKTLVMFLGRVLEQAAIAVTEHADAEWFPWRPPHRIQERTIDPLLQAAAEFLSANAGPGRPSDSP